MSACESSPAVHRWQEECGAQARALTGARWRRNSSTGIVGNRMSSTTTFPESISMVAMYRGFCLFHPKRKSGASALGLS